MRSLTFKQFMDPGFDETEEFEKLYIVRRLTDNGFAPLYVGISRAGVWERWFGRKGHIVITTGGRLVGGSAIGQMIEDALPDSLDWYIDLYTEADLRGFFNDTADYFDLEAAEHAVIRLLRPFWNKAHNSWE